MLLTSLFTAECRWWVGLDQTMGWVEFQK